MRDTLLAVIMIIMNGMVGVTLLIGGVKHREQTFNLQGANAFLSVLLPLATFALIMPDFTQTTPGPIYSVEQQFVLVIVSLALYLLFLVLQTGRFHGYFEDVGHTATEAEGAERAHLVLDCDAGRLHGGSRLSRRAIRAADRLSA